MGVRGAGAGVPRVRVWGDKRTDRRALAEHSLSPGAVGAASRLISGPTGL